jgi:hypothetical protein
MGYNLLGEREPLNCFICLRKESEVRVLVHATEVALGHFDPDQELWFPHNCICEECARKVMQIGQQGSNHDDALHPH